MKLHVNTSVRLELEELRQRLQEGAEHPYRVLVESMNEGAISLSLDGTILYCNAAFARLIECPLDQIMGRDLSERKRHEQAEAALRMRDEFLAIASHELRSPLTTLVLSLGAVEHDRMKG